MREALDVARLPLPGACSSRWDHLPPPSPRFYPLTTPLAWGPRPGGVTSHLVCQMEDIPRLWAFKVPGSRESWADQDKFVNGWGLGKGNHLNPVASRTEWRPPASAFTYSLVVMAGPAGDQSTISPDQSTFRLNGF